MKRFEPWYIPERDGDLQTYLREHDGSSSCPLFFGYDQFRMLWKEGYIEPGISAVRLMADGPGFDEHYDVTGEYGLCGIRLPAHSGRPSAHDPRILLRDRLWELQHPTLRKLYPELIEEL